METVIAIDPSAWTETTWAAAGTWATVAIYLVLAIYAVKQVGEARRLREEQARPFVVVDFDVDFLIKLRIENVGRTVARNVRMAFTPPLASSISEPWLESPVPDKGFPALVQSVDKINTELKKWTDGTRGLLVKSVDRDRELRRNDRGYWIRRATKVREDHGWKAMPRYLVERALQRRGWNRTVPLVS